jgi:hypothetical protein
MKKVIRLNENDIENLVKKIINEDNEFPRGGMVYGGKAEIIDEVINRVNEYGEEYIEQLQTLNSGFPVTKYKKVEVPTKVEVPPGVKVKSTVYPTK